jgi:hypothetical protein
MRHDVMLFVCVCVCVCVKVYLSNGDGAFCTNDTLFTDDGATKDAGVGGADPKDLNPR